MTAFSLSVLYYFACLLSCSYATENYKNGFKSSHTHQVSAETMFSRHPSTSHSQRLHALVTPQSFDPGAGMSAEIHSVAPHLVQIDPDSGDATTSTKAEPSHRLPRSASIEILPIGYLPKAHHVGFGLRSRRQGGTTIQPPASSTLEPTSMINYPRPRIGVPLLESHDLGDWTTAEYMETTATVRWEPPAPTLPLQSDPFLSSSVAASGEEASPSSAAENIIQTTLLTRVRDCPAPVGTSSEEPNPDRHIRHEAHRPGPGLHVATQLAGCDTVDAYVPAPTPTYYVRRLTPLHGAKNDTAAWKPTASLGFNFTDPLSPWMHKGADHLGVR